MNHTDREALFAKCRKEARHESLLMQPRLPLSERKHWTIRRANTLYDAALAAHKAGPKRSNGPNGPHPVRVQA